MMESADLRNRDDTSGFRRLNGASFRCVLEQSQMRSAPMIVGDKTLKVPVKASFVKYNYMVQALAADSPDHALDIGARCQGDRGADSTCLIPIAFTCSTNSWPKILSRSRSRYRGAVSHGNASRSCWAVHSAVG